MYSMGFGALTVAVPQSGNKNQLNLVVVWL